MLLTKKPTRESRFFKKISLGGKARNFCWEWCSVSHTIRARNPHACRAYPAKIDLASRSIADCSFCCYSYTTSYLSTIIKVCQYQ